MLRVLPPPPPPPTTQQSRNIAFAGAASVEMSTASSAPAGPREPGQEGGSRAAEGDLDLPVNPAAPASLTKDAVARVTWRPYDARGKQPAQGRASHPVARGCDAKAGTQMMQRPPSWAPQVRQLAREFDLRPRNLPSIWPGLTCAQIEFSTCRGGSVSLTLKFSTFRVICMLLVFS